MKRYVNCIVSLLIIWDLPFGALAENHQSAVPESRTPGTTAAGRLALCDLTSKWISIYIDENGDCWTQKKETPTEETGSNEAVLFLRQQQRKQRDMLGKESEIDETQMLRDAMKRADMRESMAVRRGLDIFEDVFRYPADLEELRWKRTRDVKK